MSRVRAAVVLAVLASFAVLATAVVAVVAHREPRTDEAAQTVTDPGSGASFEVPGDGWEVRSERSRIYYADQAGRSVAEVYGAAVFDDGYCAEQPGDSNRGFAGFTRQSFGTWVGAVSGPGIVVSTGVSHEQVRLADGRRARLSWVGLMTADGPCTATGVEIAMVRAGDIRLVLVADSVDDGTLSHQEIRDVVLSLELP